MTKVLVGGPVHQSKDYCLPFYIETLLSLSYPCDYYLSDNSPDKNHARNIQRKYGIECDWVKPDIDHPMAGICASQNQIRDRVLYGGYDYWMCIEEDVVPPKTCIELLLSFQKEVVSLPYMIGTNAVSTLCMMGLEDWDVSPLNRLVPFEESMLYFNGDLMQTKGAGLGCTLIHRSVLEQTGEFGLIRRKRKTPSDSFWYMGLQRLGIVPYIASGFGFCKHNNQEWKIN